jgi:hypothetical protein
MALCRQELQRSGASAALEVQLAALLSLIILSCALARRWFCFPGRHGTHPAGLHGRAVHGVAVPAADGWAGAQSLTSA